MAKTGTPMKYWLRHGGDRHLSRITFEIRRSHLVQQLRWHWGHITKPLQRRRALPRWVYISLAVNALLLLLLLQMGVRQYWLHQAIVLMQPSSAVAQAFTVSRNTSYSIHYTKLYEALD